MRLIRAINQPRKRLIQRRQQAGLTQADAAALCGVGTRFLGELERGKETAQIGKVLKILQGLGLTIQITLKGVNP